MTRGGRAKTRDEPERRCIATRISQPRLELIRFVVGPVDEVVPDLGGRLPGRGMWVSANSAALQQAVSRGLFARAAKCQVRVAPDLALQVEALLARQVVDLIAMARKAGQAVTGMEKTKSALVSGQTALLIQASDGSERGRSALRPPPGDNTLVSCLSRRELGLAFGRDSVIHAAVLAGGLADRIKNETRRLSGFRQNATPGTQKKSAGNGMAGEGLREKG